MRGESGYYGTFDSMLLGAVRKTGQLAMAVAVTSYCGFCSFVLFEDVWLWGSVEPDS